MGLSQKRSQKTSTKQGKQPVRRRAASFDQDLLRLIPLLRPYAYALTRDAIAADDLLQETLARAMTYHDKFRAGTNLRAWLYTIMRNQFVSEMRSRATFQSISDQLAEATPTTIGGSQLAYIELKHLNEAIEALPASQKRAIHLVGRLGLTHQEAAKIEKCAVGTMKSRLSRARARLEDVALR